MEFSVSHWRPGDGQQVAVLSETSMSPGFCVSGSGHVPSGAGAWIERVPEAVRPAAAGGGLVKPQAVRDEADERVEHFPWGDWLLTMAIRQAPPTARSAAEAVLRIRPRVIG